MAGMNPNATLPSATKRRVETVSVPFDQPRFGAPVILNAPGAAALEAAPSADVIKPLRDSKEPLPEASEVDLSQLLELEDYPQAPDVEMAHEKGGVAPEASVQVDFDGGSYGNPGTIPPDTHGAPGKTSVMTTLNNRVWWHDRSGTLRADVTLDSFWNVFGVPIDTFDPKTFNDELTGRFISVVCGNARLPSSCLLVAVSHTDDPQGNWSFGRITVDPATMGHVWIDYPSVGFTEDKITICVNLFTIDANSFAGVALFVIDKPSFLSPPHNFDFDQFVVSDQGGTLCPAIVADAGVSDQYLVSNWTGSYNGNGYLALYKIDGSVAAGTTNFTRVGFLKMPRTWSFGFSGDQAPQKNTPHRINTGDARMHWVVHRHGKLQLSHTVFVPASSPARSAIQWAEVSLTGTPSMSQSQLIGGTNSETYFAYPSLAVNSDGDTLIGMAAFSSSIFASGAYAFKPAGGSFASPVIYAPGKNTYHLTFSGTRNRWGDYSSTHVDPADTRNFWTVQEYAGPTADRWRTRWASIAPPAAVPTV
ncbi:hypothetical protein [Roseibium sp. Sym1]|uniref:hypothetical protein n=1 Tax=Roseibium sp. Sym1 TaxID=3016006 RepID=UPI0022B4CE9D|nr:hypothetical protein [Roseibium sp. Sym1]